jgi:hypothetical protein
MELFLKKEGCDEQNSSSSNSFGLNCYMNSMPVCIFRNIKSSNKITLLAI